MAALPESSNGSCAGRPSFGEDARSEVARALGRGRHMPVDPAVHAAMHAQLLGTWSGTLTSTAGSPSTLHLVIANDKQGKLTVKMSADPSMKAGAASDVEIDLLGLHWTQALADTSCKATAALDAANHHPPETVSGTVACEHSELAFALHRTKG